MLEYGYVTADDGGTGGGDTITGGGTESYYAVFSGSTEIGNGYIYQDNTHGLPYVIYINDISNASLIDLNVSGTIHAPSYKVNGTGGLGYINFLAQSIAPSPPATTGFNLYSDSHGDLSWVHNHIVDGDTYTRTINGILSANRQYSLQDASMTLAGTALAYGGTNANLTAVNGGIVYSNASAMAISAAGSSGQILVSAGAGAPTWSTAIFPITATVNSVIYATATNVLGESANFTFNGTRLSPNYITLAAGTATAGTAPLKFTSGTNLGTAEAGAMEYNGTNLFFTRSGTTRQTVLTANVVAAEVVVSDTTVTVNIAGTDYKLLARA